MIPVQFEYVAPTSLDEAVKSLQQQGASVLAGGMSLMPAMKLRRAAPSKLVDLRKISGLRKIEHGQTLRISAMTTYADLTDDEKIASQYLALSEAINALSDPQVRNRATLVGSLTQNDPAADLPAVALALEATIQIASAAGTRTLPINQFLLGPQKTALQPGEIVTAVEFPALAAGTGSTYEKFKHPASGYAVCGVTAVVVKSANGTIGKCRVALTGAADQAARLSAVETALEGQIPTPEKIVLAAKLAAEAGLAWRTDVYASADYRANLAAVLTERALLQAASRAGFVVK